MYLLTTMSLDDLAELIRAKEVSLDNGEFLVGGNFEVIDKYFHDNLGSDGYVVGLRGRLSKKATEVLQTFDNQIITGGSVVLEAEVNEDDVLRYSAAGMSEAISAIQYGLDDSDIVHLLDSSLVKDAKPTGVEVLCVPSIKANGRIRVTYFPRELEFKVDGITFVKMN